MPGDFKNFHESLERDLQQLAAEIQEMRTNTERGPAMSDREIVKRSLEKVTSEIIAPPPSFTAPTTGTTNGLPLPSYLMGDKTDPRIRLEVERLIDMVFHESLEKAVKEAKRHSPFVLDAFHDALTDKLVPILIERGILK